MVVWSFILLIISIFHFCPYLVSLGRWRGCGAGCSRRAQHSASEVFKCSSHRSVWILSSSWSTGFRGRWYSTLPAYQYMKGSSACVHTHVHAVGVWKYWSQGLPPDLLDQNHWQWGLGLCTLTSGGEQHPACQVISIWRAIAEHERELDKLRAIGLGIW